MKINIIAILVNQIIERPWKDFYSTLLGAVPISIYQKIRQPVLLPIFLTILRRKQDLKSLNKEWYFVSWNHSNQTVYGLLSFSLWVWNRGFESDKIDKKQLGKDRLSQSLGNLERQGLVTLKCRWQIQMEIIKLKWPVNKWNLIPW